MGKRLPKPGPNRTCAWCRSRPRSSSMCKPCTAFGIDWCNVARHGSTRSGGFLLERGITFAAQPIHLRKNLPSVVEDAEQNLSPRLRWLLDRMWQEGEQK